MVAVRLMRTYSKPIGDPVESIGNTYYVVDEHYVVHTIGFSGWRSPKNLLYSACPNFWLRFSSVLPLGIVDEWTRKKDFEAWIHKQLFFSYAATTKENTRIPWFVLKVSVGARSVKSFIPTLYRYVFEDIYYNCWILIQSGWKVYSVQIIGGETGGGWNDFWHDHQLRGNFVLMLGAEWQWIFNVVVLDAQHNRVMYPWTKDVDKINVVLPQPDGLVTTFSSSMLVTSIYKIQFGHSYRSPHGLGEEFSCRFAMYLEDEAVTKLQFIIGKSKWILEKGDHDIRQRWVGFCVKKLELVVGDFLFVAAVSAYEIRVMLFDRNGIERHFSWAS